MSGTVILILVLALIVVAGAAVLVANDLLGEWSGWRGLREWRGWQGLRGWLESLGWRGNNGGVSGRSLRRQFGPEYDYLLAQFGDPKAVERELVERVREHGTLTLRPLAPEERERYERAWAGAQERFIDDPRDAARRADQVVVGLLTAIGYPSDDRDRQLALASVDHAYVLTDYRQARELVDRLAAPSDSRSDSGYGSRGGGRNRNDSGASSNGIAVADPTEALRQAVLRCRIMFKALLDASPSASVPAPASASALGRANAVR